MKTQKINVPLLRKVQAAILEEPRRLNMWRWVERHDPEQYGKNAPPCGTVACIAGWSMLFNKSKAKEAQAIRKRVATTMEGVMQGHNDRAIKAGIRVLRITKDQAGELFFVGGWPDKYQDQWDRAKSPRAYARVAARRIDAFIRQYAGGKDTP